MSIDTSAYEKGETFIYLGSLLINHNSIRGEIKCRLGAEIHVIIQSKHFYESEIIYIHTLVQYIPSPGINTDTSVNAAFTADKVAKSHNDIADC